MLDIEKEFTILSSLLDRHDIHLFRNDNRMISKYLYVLHEKDGSVVIARSKETFVFLNDFRGINYKKIMDQFYKIRDSKQKIIKCLK